MKRPLHERFGSETVTNLQRLHVTAIPQRTQAPVRGATVAACNGHGRWLDGVVSAMSACLGVAQIATGGHNARGNAVAERANQTLGRVLRTASDSECKNVKEHLQCISFAHNITCNSVTETSPFQAGHGLKARTVSEARMDLPRLQFDAEEGMSADAAKLWEKGLPKK